MTSGPRLTWTPIHSEKAEEYIQSFIDGIIDEEPRYNQQVLPSVAGLTLYSWADHEETGFADILERTNKLQESFLLNNGLNGNYNSAIAKLVLGKHGYKDESAVTGADNKPLIPEYSDAEIARRALFAMTKMLNASEELDE